jgi:hypothetical protein
MVKVGVIKINCIRLFKIIFKDIEAKGITCNV